MAKKSGLNVHVTKFKSFILMKLKRSIKENLLFLNFNFKLTFAGKI